MHSVHDKLGQVYRANFGLLNMITDKLSREEAEEFFEFLEKIYETGIAKENDYWRTYGHKS